MATWSIIQNQLFFRPEKSILPIQIRTSYLLSERHVVCSYQCGETISELQPLTGLLFIPQMARVWRAMVE
jgi:hypothetical protein